MPPRHLLKLLLATVGLALAFTSLSLQGGVPAIATPKSDYGVSGDHSSSHGGSAQAWVDTNRTQPGRKHPGISKTGGASAGGPSLYDLFNEYDKLMSEGKKDQALPVMKKAWGIAGCGKYDPKGVCAVLIPDGKNTGPSPMQLVQQVVASLGYQSPSIGVAPNHSIHHLTTQSGKQLDNVVGYPTWFWAVGGTQIDKKITKSEYGMQVSLSIHPDSLTVDPGDGTTFTCAGMGTEWTPRVEPETPSPTCGYTYAKTGTYSVRMTTKWTVHYVIAGPGVNAAGDIPVQGWHQRDLVIGELQTVIVH